MSESTQQICYGDGRNGIQSYNSPESTMHDICPVFGDLIVGIRGTGGVESSYGWTFSSATERRPKEGGKWEGNTSDK